MSHPHTTAGPVRGRGAVWIAALATLALLPAAADAQCTGDCNENNVVAINELIAAVNAAQTGCP